MGSILCTATFKRPGMFILWFIAEIILGHETSEKGHQNAYVEWTFLVQHSYMLWPLSYSTTVGKSYQIFKSRTADENVHRLPWDAQKFVRKVYRVSRRFSEDQKIQLQLHAHVFCILCLVMLGPVNGHPSPLSCLNVVCMCRQICVFLYKPS